MFNYSVVVRCPSSTDDIVRRRAVCERVFTYLLACLLTYTYRPIDSITTAIMALYLEGLCGHSDTTDSHMI